MVAVTWSRAASDRMVARFLEPSADLLGCHFGPADIAHSWADGFDQRRTIRFFDFLIGCGLALLAFLVLLSCLRSFERSWVTAAKIEVGCDKPCADSVNGLKATDGGVDVIGINLDAVTIPPGLFSCDQGRAASGKSIENGAATFGAIENCVRHQSNRLDRRMHGKLVASIAPKLFWPA